MARQVRCADSPYCACVPVCIEDPRRTPRVPVQLRADVSVGSASWEGVTLDLSPGGCHLVGDQCLPVGTEVTLSLRSGKLPKLHAKGTVKWSIRSRCGVAFRNDDDAMSAAAWFRRFTQSQPLLAFTADRQRPRRVPMDAILTRRRELPGSVPLSSSERRILALVAERTPLRAVALTSRLDPQAFAQSLFALIEKGLVAADVTVPA